jgi:hypothetical protein
MLAHVRFGSLADMTRLDCDVRYTPESGHYPRVYEYMPWDESSGSLVPTPLASVSLSG